MGQALPPGGGLTLSAPISPPQQTAYHVATLSIDIDHASGLMAYQILDTNGNVVASSSVQLTAAMVNALAAMTKSTVYADLQTQLGISGTVT
jgi:hypothetical protein